MLIIRGLLILCLVLPGCGGGSGDGSAPVEPTATAAVATASPSSTATPTARASPFPEVLLAAGRSFRAADEGALILRNDGAGWHAVDLAAAPPLALVNGVVFSEPEVAWAYGFIGDQETALLLRSADAGRTWSDVTAALPADTKGIYDLAWADASVGYLVSRGIFRPPLVFATTDGGQTWGRFDTFTSGTLPGQYAIGTRAGAVELLAQDHGPLTVIRVDLPDSPATTLASSPNFLGSNSFATLGAEGWIVTAPPARIFRSDAPGEPWTAMPLNSGGSAEMICLDVRDATNAVAGGKGVILVMRTDGSAWDLASGVPASALVVDVLRAQGDTAWAIAGTSSTNDSAFLRSDDGGRTWRREPTTFEAGVRLGDLARSSKRE